MGLDVFERANARCGAGEARLTAFRGGEVLGVTWGCGREVESPLLASCVGSVFGGDEAGDRPMGVEGRDRGTFMAVVGLMVDEGVVNALRRFSLSSVVLTAGRGSSSCSIFLFFGLKIGGGLTVGSMGLATEACRYSSIIPWGAFLMVVLVGFGLSAISRAAITPVGFLGCCGKRGIALASFLNLSKRPFFGAVFLGALGSNFPNPI